MTKSKTTYGPILGSHCSTAGGCAMAIERAGQIGAEALQIFVKGNTRWAWPPLKPEDAKAFRERLRTSGIRSCIAHAIYLVNLASTNAGFVKKSIEDMIDELQRCDQLGIDGLVMHPGAHMGAGLEVGIEQIAAGLNAIIAATPKVKCRVLLETTAGQGSAIGGSFEHIAQIMKRVSRKSRLGVCLDTCHVFASGYEIRYKKSYEAMWKDFDRIIGLKNLFAIHLNDSKKPFGSHKDRHEHIGKGEIGLDAFRLIMNDKRLRDIPMVLETEKDPEGKLDVENLRVLRSLIAG